MIADADNGVQSELLSGETLLWSGKPHPWLLLRSLDLLMVPFGLTFLGAGLTVAVSGFAPSTANQGNQPPYFFFLTFPLVFIIVGAYLSFGRLGWECWLRSRTLYAVSDRRAIIVQKALQRSTKSVFLADLRAMRLTVGRNGVGTITFDDGVVAGGYWAGYAAMWGMGPSGFELIDKAQDVYRLIVEAQASLRK